MGFLSSLFKVLSNTANLAEKDITRKTNSYSSGYRSGSEKASQMSDEELYSSLKKAKENGISDWKRAGDVRAMANEYKNRKQ